MLCSSVTFGTRQFWQVVSVVLQVPRLPVHVVSDACVLLRFAAQAVRSPLHVPRFPVHVVRFPEHVVKLPVHVVRSVLHVGPARDGRAPWCRALTSALPSALAAGARVEHVAHAVAEQVDGEDQAEERGGGRAEIPPHDGVARQLVARLIDHLPQLPSRPRPSHDSTPSGRQRDDEGPRRGVR